MTIGERIHIVRKTAGLTQAEFCERIGVKRTTVASYELGKTYPSNRTVADICRKFSVSEQWLRTGDGEMLANLTREQEIADFLASLVHDPENSSVKSFILAVSKLSPREWEILFQIAKDWVEEMEK